MELSEMLRRYLKCFVDNVIDALIENKKLSRFHMFDDAEKVFTFNYTKLMEKNYPTFRRLLHIHGDTDGELVLGVNDNEKDELAALDTSFIEFKKYFQRIFYEYEYQYRNEITDMISEQEHMKEEYELWVFGHSLDITDRDIIKELFGIANRIIIFYHKATAKKDYIRNLVTIYGKEAFDELRIDTNLRFLKIGSETD